MEKMKRLAAMLLAVLMCCFAAACSAEQPQSGETTAVPIAATEAENLEKLCKVWGYAKYTHPVFLKGEKNWDEELLSIIDEVQAVQTGEETNEILHQWFRSLGEIESTSTSKEDETDDVQADLSWTKDLSYLGQELAADMELLSKAKNVRNRAKAPVQFTPYSDFSNEPVYDSFDYSNENERLLGLFRLWNAMEYYYPYLSILDEDWDKVLKEAIPEILAAEDETSYQLAIRKTAAKLQDSHVDFQDNSLFDELWGSRYAPLKLAYVDGQFVVREAVNEECAVKAGDILLSIDGVSMEELVQERGQYISLTTEDKLISNLNNYLLASHNEIVEIIVLGENGEETHSVKTVEEKPGYKYPEPELSHEILEGNIGLINPAKVATENYNMNVLSSYNIINIMEDLKGTDGLIIDFRQYPTEHLAQILPLFLVDGLQTFAKISYPSTVVPGNFTWEETTAGYYSSSQDSYSYRYENPVVLLMNETTQSNPEYTIMALRKGNNVTVMGENSIGSDGNVRTLNIPGCGMMNYTSIGIYTPDGGQTQRCGLTPDLYVEETVEGIREGRDEMMEAAIAFLQNQ